MKHEIFSQKKPSKTEIVKEFKRLATMTKETLSMERNVYAMQYFTSCLIDVLGGREEIIVSKNKSMSDYALKLKMPVDVTRKLFELLHSDYKKNKKSWNDIKIDSVLFLFSKITNTLEKEAVMFSDERYKEYLSYCERKLEQQGDQKKYDKDIINRLADENRKLSQENKKLKDKLNTKSFVNKSCDAREQDDIRRIKQERDVAIEKFEMYKKAFQDVVNKVRSMANVCEGGNNLNDSYDNVIKSSKM